jgi:hypothetical protein
MCVGLLTSFVKKVYHTILSAVTVNDWDLYQKLLDHLLARHIKTTADLHPIMMTEAPVSERTGIECYPSPLISVVSFSCFRSGT